MAERPRDAPRSAEQLLADYRAAAGPSQATQARMLESLHSHVLPPDPGSATGGAVGSSGAAAGKATLVKVAVALCLVTGGALVAAAPWIEARVLGGSQAEHELPSVRSSAPASIEPRSEPELEVVPRPEPVPMPMPEPVSVLEPAPTLADPEPSDEGNELDTRTRPRSKQPRSRQRSAEPAPSLADEAKLLRAVDMALRGGDLEAARSLLDDYERSFTAGSLGSRANVLELLLGCTEGDPAAQRAAARFLDEHLGDNLSARLEDTCELK